METTEIPNACLKGCTTLWSNLALGFKMGALRKKGEEEKTTKGEGEKQRDSL